MLQLERLEKIKEHLIKNEYADMDELAQILDVSTATVRRSLKQLENDSLVELTRGGARLAKKGHLYEHPYLVKREMNAAEKRRIVHKAVGLIGKNESVFLDSSSTVYEMTRFLKEFHQITVATNDVLIAGALTDAEDITVNVIGGTLRKHYYTLSGYFSEMILDELRFDYTFLGIDSISLKGGLMITNVEEVRVKKKAARLANKVVVLCDHSKYEQEAFLNVIGFDEVAMVITGEELDKDTYQRYVDAGVNIVLV